MDLSALQTTLREFAAERNWQPFHTPKNLATALMVEAAELAEIFQWMTPEQSQVAHHDQVTQERIADEVADVMLYLLQMADHSAVDLKRAIGRKLVKNARKYPPVKPGVPVGPTAAAAPQTHVLVDWENVQPKDADIRSLVPDVTDVWLFHGPNQRRVDKDQASFGERVTLVPISRAGKNALDFHLSFYMGYIASRNPAARFVVLSNDQGYAPMLEHALGLGFSATLVGFGPGRGPRVAGKKAAAKAPARKASTGRRAAAPAKAGAPRPGAAPAPAPRPAPQPPPAPSAAAAAEAAVPSTAAGAPAAEPAPQRPAAKKAAARKSTRGKAAAEAATRVTSAAVAEPVADADAAVPAKKAAAQQPAAPAKKAARKSAARKAVAAPPPAAPAEPAADAAPPARKKPAAKAARAAAAKAPEPAAAPVAPPAPAVPPAPAFDLNKALKHVEASLRKTANKPARRARLVATIRSLLGKAADDTTTARVLDRLLDSGRVSIDGKGAVAYAL